MGTLTVFLIAQVIFLSVHSVINIRALNFYRDTPTTIDRIAKLIVYPNFLIADIYLPMPADIKAEYDKQVNAVLGIPTTSIP